MRRIDERAARALLLPALAAVLALGPGGCALVATDGETYQDAVDAEPEGTAFNKQLYASYMELSEGELGEYDWLDARHFATKALAAARDQDVRPDPLTDRNLPADKRGEIAAARAQLVGALARGGTVRAPERAARAQASFDCWLQEQEENHQPDDIAACRDAFRTALALLEEALGHRYVVYFDFDSAGVSPDAEALILEAAAAAKAQPDTTLMLAGHADRAGAETYNLGLSHDRVAAIRALLLSAGVKAEQIGVARFGEARPAIATPDDTAEPANRRVEIDLVR